MMSKAAWLGLVIVTLKTKGFTKKRINEIIKKIEKLQTNINPTELERSYSKLLKTKKEKKQNAN